MIEARPTAVCSNRHPQQLSPPPSFSIEIELIEQFLALWGGEKIQTLGVGERTAVRDWLASQRAHHRNFDLLAVGRVGNVRHLAT